MTPIRDIVITINAREPNSGTAIACCTSGFSGAIASGFIPRAEMHSLDFKNRFHVFWSWNMLSCCSCSVALGWVFVNKSILEFIVETVSM